MPLPIRCLVAVAIVVAAVSARSETAPGPYAGQQARPVKALSESEMNGLLDGSGAGFAKADQLFSQKQANPPALLGPEQVRRYAVLRGYASDTGGVAPMDPVTPSHHHHSHDRSHAASIGVPGKAAKVSRSVNVDMTDTMRFNPASIDVKQGETIRFVVKNSGQLKHEFVLGTDKELKAHYELMKKFPEMEHSDPNQVTVAPGKAGEVIWQFTKAGKVDFACLQPGHYDAGMKGIVNVAAGKGAATQTNGTTAPSASAQGSAAVAGAMTEGEVRKVDKESKKITLKHGEIKNLEMPGMTMVFQVKDPAMLDAVKQGDKVRFKAEKAGGAIVITDIQVAK